MLVESIGHPIEIFSVSLLVRSTDVLLEILLYLGTIMTSEKDNAGVILIFKIGSFPRTIFYR